MNKVMLIGNSGSDAKLEYTQSKMAICNLSIATSEKQADGTFKSAWHRVCTFGKLAESIGNRIKKGSRVFVDGKLNPREWTDKEGNKKSSVDIVAWNVQIIEKEVRSQNPQSDPTWTDENIPF